MEIPTDRILDRDLVRAAIEEYREKAAPALAGVVDEGIAVFERCSSSARGRDENLGILFPALHVFEMLDGVDILLLEGAVVPARVVLRAAFEAKLIVEYNTEADQPRRGAAYVVAEIHRRIAALRRWDPDTQEGKQLQAELAKDHIARGLDVPEVEDLDRRIEGLTELLEEPHLKEAADEYERLKAASGRRPSPYSLWDGPGNVQQLARHLGRGAQYEFLYRNWSLTTHGLDLDRQLTSQDGAAAIRVFRDPSEIRTTYSLAISFGLQTIRSVLAYYRPGELERGTLARWYAEEVRPVQQALDGDRSEKGSEDLDPR